MAQNPPVATGVEIRIGGDVFQGFFQRWDKLSDTGAGVWFRTLDWSAKNPFQFFAVLAFLGWLAIQCVRIRREIASMKLDYDQERTTARSERGERDV